METERQGDGLRRDGRVPLDVVFCQYDRRKYADALGHLVAVLARLRSVDYRLTVVDNAQAGDWRHRVSHRLLHVGGDNSAWEFSAFEKGLSVIAEEPRPGGVVALATDALLAYGDEFLSLIDDRVIEMASRTPAAVGWIDSFGQELELLGRRYEAWLRSSLVFLPADCLPLVRPLTGDLREEEIFGPSPSAPFLRSAPLSENLRSLLLDWLTGSDTEAEPGESWHSRFELTAETLPFFRRKVTAILREHLLSTKLQRHAIPCFDFRAVRRLPGWGGVPPSHELLRRWEWTGWLAGHHEHKLPAAAGSTPRLVFAGDLSDWRCRQGVESLTSGVLPLVRQRHPATRLVVVSQGMPTDHYRLEGEAHVDLVEGFERLPEQLAAASALLVPIAEGAGLREGILAALDGGTPVVGQRAAIEAAGRGSSPPCVVAETPIALVRAACGAVSAAARRRSKRRRTLALVADAGHDTAPHDLLAPSRRASKGPLDWTLPTTVVGSYREYLTHVERAAAAAVERQAYESALVAGEESFTFEARCYLCRRWVPMHVDFAYAHEKRVDGGTMPNWRERLVCPACGLNNRMRAAVHIAEQLGGLGASSRVYLTEAATALYQSLSGRYRSLVGSEYLGETIARGATNEAGWRNEDLTRLTFDDGAFDAVVTLDVLEHVPDYDRALQECYRVLASGGRLIFSVPFRLDLERTVIRAVIGPEGRVEHLLPAEYHGDPIQADGCLAYYHFAWDLLDRLRDIGFERVTARFYWSPEFGYLGGEQVIFVAAKGAR